MKWKHITSTLMECCESNSGKLGFRDNVYAKKSERFQIKKVILHLKELKEQIIPKVSRIRK